MFYLIAFLVMFFSSNFATLASNLFIICGPCGAGKTSLVNRFFADQELDSSFTRFTRLVSWTSRTLREGEVEGQDFFFEKQVVDFEQKKAENGFLIVKKIAGNFYGLPIPEKENSIAVVDVSSALEIKKKIPNCCLIVIVAPEVELNRRMISRGFLSIDHLQTRMAHNSNELNLINQEKNRVCFDCEILNSDLETAFLKLKSFLKAQLG